MQVLRHLASVPGGRGVLRHPRVAEGEAGAAGKYRVRCWGRRGGDPGGTGARAGGIRAGAPAADRALGADRSQTAIAGRRDRWHLVHTYVPRRELSGTPTATSRFG